MSMLRKKNAHLWTRDKNDFYVEESWCDHRLFEVEEFHGEIDDPCCGLGRIVKAAHQAGYKANGYDLIERKGAYGLKATEDFLKTKAKRDNIVCNPPFGIIEEFTLHVLQVTQRKAALLFPIRRVTAASEWIARGKLPLSCIYWLTPRPSMPPGRIIMRGIKPGRGLQDFCWLIFDRSHHGEPFHRWLHRDR